MTNINEIKDLLIGNNIPYLPTKHNEVDALLVSIKFYDKAEALLNINIDMFYIDVLDEFFIIY